MAVGLVVTPDAAARTISVFPVPVGWPRVMVSEAVPELPCADWTMPLGGGPAANETVCPDDVLLPIVQVEAYADDPEADSAYPRAAQHAVSCDPVVNGDPAVNEDTVEFAQASVTTSAPAVALPPSAGAAHDVDVAALACPVAAWSITPEQPRNTSAAPPAWVAPALVTVMVEPSGMACGVR